VAASKEQKLSKSFAEKLLRIQGIDYDDWLDQKHKEIINENQSLMMSLLDSKLDKIAINSATESKNGSTPEQT
jgi:hypothetical protein